MSLASAPTITMGAAGNVYASNSLANNASHSISPIYVGVAGQTGAQGTTTTGSAVAARLQVWNTGGVSVAATNGLQVQLFSTSDGTNYDTIFYGVNSTITTVASTASLASWDIPPGQYKLTLTNLDVTNAVTVEVTLGTIA